MNDFISPMNVRLMFVNVLLIVVKILCGFFCFVFYCGESNVYFREINDNCRGCNYHCR